MKPTEPPTAPPMIVLLLDLCGRDESDVVGRVEFKEAPEVWVRVGEAVGEAESVADDEDKSAG